MSSTQNVKDTTMDQGFDLIDAAVTKLKRILEGKPEPAFESHEFTRNYTAVYNMCNQKPPNDRSQELYDKYCSIFEDYDKHTVLPSIMEKHDEYMLRELARSLPGLREVGMTCFRDHVYNNVHFSVKQVIIALIHKEREGQQIDGELVKNILDLFVQNGMGSMERYEADFEMFFLQETASYYSRRSSSWIQEYSCPEYMKKCEESLKKEKERVTHYLHSTTEPKLVEIVQTHLLVLVAKQLLEKEHSGCSALLRDGKVDDLSSMYRLYHTIPKGLEPVVEAFRLHVTAEGNALIKQAEDAATSGSVEEEVLVKKIIDLHDKYMVYVTDCFQNNTLFHKALKEAFEIFCNKKVAGSSSAELLATFCDNLFSKAGNDKSNDESTIESTIDNVNVFF
ncbi:hypothetical protein Bca4012_021294 [Brassica carinata]